MTVYRIHACPGHICYIAMSVFKPAKFGFVNLQHTIDFGGRANEKKVILHLKLGKGIPFTAPTGRFVPPGTDPGRI